MRIASVEHPVRLNDAHVCINVTAAEYRISAVGKYQFAVIRGNTAFGETPHSGGRRIEPAAPICAKLRTLTGKTACPTMRQTWGGKDAERRALDRDRQIWMLRVLAR